MILQHIADVELDENLRDALQEFVGTVVAPPGTPNKFVQTCLNGMGDIKSWLQSLSDRLNTASVLNSGQQEEALQMIEFQQSSLVAQHELLGVIAFLLIKQNHTVLGDFDMMLDTLKNVDKYDNLLREQHSL